MIGIIGPIRNINAGYKKVERGFDWIVTESLSEKQNIKKDPVNWFTISIVLHRVVSRSMKVQKKRKRKLSLILLYVDI